MISRCNCLPKINKNNAELIKIKCLYDVYKDDEKVLFWKQDNYKALISMTDGNMIIFNNGANLQELREFTDMLMPVCVFSDYDTLCAIDRAPNEYINVMFKKSDIKGEPVGDTLSSKEIYDLLNVEGLSLPEYPYFAVDYCRRINHGAADYFAIKGRFAVISFKTGKKAIINGVASHEKGGGTRALIGILQKNYGKTVLVCCREKVKGFYIKNGFSFLYYGGYWVKNP